MKLTSQDQQWLEQYRRILDEQCPGLVEQVVIFGSKARGTATPESDLDVLVVIREGDWRVKDRVAEPGYDLAIGTQVVPSILVYTRTEWDVLQGDEAPFWKVVSRDGVVVG